VKQFTVWQKSLYFKADSRSVGERMRSPRDALAAQPPAIEESNQQQGNVIEGEVTNDSAASELVGFVQRRICMVKQVWFISSSSESGVRNHGSYTLGYSPLQV
jgi:hypothetical protein